MLAVGYSDHLGSFIVRNSWGKDWVIIDSFHEKIVLFCIIVGGSRILLYSI
jgi:hypothetical protein